MQNQYRSTSISISGAAHGDELGYLFRTFLHDTIISEITPDSVEDKAIDRITALWTRFAKYGDPTSGDFNEFKWEPVTNDTFNYVDFGSTTTNPGVNPDEDRMNFWHDVYSSSNFLTYSKSLLIVVSIVSTLLFNSKE